MLTKTLIDTASINTIKFRKFKAFIFGINEAFRLFIFIWMLFVSTNSIIKLLLIERELSINSIYPI